jgi:hypothetical protein
MPKKIDAEPKAKAVRLVRQQPQDYPSATAPRWWWRGDHEAAAGLDL